MHNLIIFIASSSFLFYLSYTSRGGKKAGYFILSGLLWGSATLAVSGIRWYVAVMVVLIFYGCFFKKNLRLKEFFEKK